MQSHQSLAELTLHWCAAEILPDRSAKVSHAERQALLKASREASKAAGVALLQAAAAEMDFADGAALGVVAAVIEDDAALENLEARLSDQSQPAGTPQGRAEFVARHFKEWMEEHVGSELPDRVHRWLRYGWPDLRARGGTMTFYQAFCGALQRTVRQDQAAWDNLVKHTGLEATSWRQWLIREADAANQPPTRSAGKKAAKIFAAMTIVTLLASAGGWYWWKTIDGRLRTLNATHSEAPAAIPPSTKQAEPSPLSASAESQPAAEQTPIAAQEVPLKPAATPSPQPSPSVTAQIPAESSKATKPDEPSPQVASKAMEEPRVNVRPDPFAEAARLMTEAESTLASGNPESGDRFARSAQDILSVRLPSNDAKLAEGLIRVGQYWERRDDWAEAARVYQRAVKAYEKTPAENANPQLQAVNRWASALRHTGRNTEAERLYRTLLQAYEGMGTELIPEMASVAHNLGNVLLATGRLRDARESYGLAIKLLADRQSDPAVEPLITRFKQTYIESLRKLGVSEAQIDADMRQLLGAKIPPKSPGVR